MSKEETLVECSACRDIKLGTPGICSAHGLIRLQEEATQEMRKKFQTKALGIVTKFFSFGSRGESAGRIPEGHQIVEDWQPRFTRKSVDLLQAMKRERGLRDIDALIKAFSESAGGRPIPEASEAILKSPRPVCITSLPNGGKTFTVREIIKRAQENVFVLDVSDEYQECRRLSFPEVFALDWQREVGQFRFVPMPMAEMSIKEADLMFDWFQMMKGDGRFKGWTFVIEEAHRFKSIDSVKAFIAEGRKFAKVVIVVSTDWEAYESMCELFKPFPIKEPEPQAQILREVLDVTTSVDTQSQTPSKGGNI